MGDISEMTKTDMKPRCGDHVKHYPTGETWTVAYVEGDKLAWCGWPPGEARLGDCELIHRCTDKEHLGLLARCARLPESDARGRHARALLDKEGK